MTFKIGDKVRYNKAAFEKPNLFGLKNFAREGIFTVTGLESSGAKTFTISLDNEERVHESRLEKVEEEYGVGDIICARKGKEIIQGSLVRRRGGNLGFAPSGQIGSSDLAQWYQRGWSIVATDSVNSPEPESGYVMFPAQGSRSQPTLAFKSEDGLWVDDLSKGSWEEMLWEYGPEYVELVEK